MKIAVLSDVHGYFTALEAVVDDIDRWRPDVVVVNGDVVNRGPRPCESWALVDQRRQTDGWLVTRGNHEDYVTQWLKPDDERRENHVLSNWTFRQLGRETTAVLADLPKIVTFSHPQGGEVRAVHASMRHPRYGIWHHSPDEEVREQIAPSPAVFLTGHIHYPFVRQLDQTLIVNSGSAGTLCDHGDPRASYAQLTWQGGAWQAEIVRVPYDRQRVDSAHYETGFLDEVGPLAGVIYLEWKTGWPIVSAWGKDPQWREVSAEFGSEESARRFLAEFELTETFKADVAAFYRMNKGQ